MKKRIRLMIKGRVQGVWFRASTQEKAIELGVNGWVRNRRDGSVEVLAEGDALKVEELKKWCHRGPRGAIVTQVESEELEFLGDLSGFDIKPTV